MEKVDDPMVEIKKEEVPICDVCGELGIFFVSDRRSAKHSLLSPFSVSRGLLRERVLQLLSSLLHGLLCGQVYRTCP